MFCQSCGAKLDDGASFCGCCGADLQSQSADPAGEPGFTPNCGWQYAPEINDYLTLNILVTLLCCFPWTGIAGIVFSALAGSANDRGEYMKASGYARIAKILFWITVAFGIGQAITVMFVFGIASVAALLGIN